jgi:hypothetical protein
MNFTVVQQKLEITQKELDATKTLLTSTTSSTNADAVIADLTTKLNGK